MRIASINNKKCKSCGNIIYNVTNAKLYCPNCISPNRKEYMKNYRKTWKKGQNRKKSPDENWKKIGVYIVYNLDKIIYVGRTSNLQPRISTHRRQNSEWLKEYTKIEFIPYNTSGDSLVAEAILIRDHQPKYNRDGVIR